MPPLAISKADLTRLVEITGASIRAAVAPLAESGGLGEAAAAAPAAAELREAA